MKNTKDATNHRRQVEAELSRFSGHGNIDEFVEFSKEHPDVLPLLPTLRKAVKERFRNSAPTVKIFEDINEEPPVKRIRLAVYKDEQHLLPPVSINAAGEGNGPPTVIPLNELCQYARNVRKATNVDVSQIGNKINYDPISEHMQKVRAFDTWLSKTHPHVSEYIHVF